MSLKVEQLKIQLNPLHYPGEGVRVGISIISPFSFHYFVEIFENYSGKVHLLQQD
jgi:hypothetical protein